MAFLRAALITKSTDGSSVIANFNENYNIRLLGELGDLSLFAYEGRSQIDIDEQESLTLLVDDEDHYYISGDSELAASFNARIEFTIGYCLSASNKNILANNAPTQRLLNEIDAFIGSDIQEEDGYVNCQIRISAGPQAESLLLKLGNLSDFCHELGIEHRVATFDDDCYPKVLGSLEDLGYYWIGPSAYVMANYNEDELIVNASEIFYNGNSLFF